MASSLMVGPTPQALVDIPVEPNVFDYELMDISSPDAGRVRDANSTMYKMRVGQKRKIKLEWVNLTLEQTSQILNMFDPEYIFVRYVDPKAGGFEVRQFYSGDKSIPYRRISLDDGMGGRTVLEKVSFNLVEV